MIKRELNFSADIVLTPKELAQSFCSLDPTDQALFFNELAEMSSKWDAPFAYQMQFVADDPALNNMGRIIMRVIGEYGQHDATPQLLDALESLVGRYAMVENYGAKIYATKDQIAKAKAAIAAAKGE